MFGIQKKTILFFFLVFPFFEPGIFEIVSALSIYAEIYKYWRAASVVVIVIKFLTRGKINLFQLSVSVYILWLLLSCALNECLNPLSFASLCGSSLAICMLVDIAYKNGSHENLFRVIINILTVYILINAVTILIFHGSSGIVSDVEGNRMRYFNYFLGYDNQHVYFFLLYLPLSLIDDRERKGKVCRRTVVMHGVVIWSTIVCWSSDTVVALTVFYALLVFRKWKVIQKYLNAWTTIILNLIAFCLIIFGKIYYRFAEMIVNVLGKDLRLAREGIWDNYVRFVSKAPVLGNGYVDTETRYIMTRASHAHNMYLDLLFVGGIVGLFLFILIVFFGMNRGKRVSSTNGVILFASIFAYMIAFQATASPYCPTFFFLLAISYSMNGVSQQIQVPAVQRRSYKTNYV